MGTPRSGGDLETLYRPIDLSDASFGLYDAEGAGNELRPAVRGGEGTKALKDRADRLDRMERGKHTHSTQASGLAPPAGRANSPPLSSGGRAKS